MINVLRCNANTQLDSSQTPYANRCEREARKKAKKNGRGIFVSIILVPGEHSNKRDKKKKQQAKRQQHPPPNRKSHPTKVRIISYHIRHVATGQATLLDLFFFREMVSATTAAQPMPNLARASALTDFVAAQVLELRTRRAVDVVVFAGEAVLTRVGKGVVFVAPVAGVVEPVDGCFGRVGGRAEDLCGVVVDEGVSVLRWVPERAAVGLVVEQAEG